MFCVIILPHPEGNNRGNKENRAVSGIRPAAAKLYAAEMEQILKADTRKKNDELNDTSSVKTFQSWSYN